MKKFLLPALMSLLAFGLTTGVVAQNTVHGIVRSRDGSELPGVNVRIKSTTQGTMTDLTGRYEIAVNSASDTLVFTFIGFKMQQVAVRQRNTVDVVLETEETELEEVVVTGFQEVERKLFTGSSVNLKLA
jgi:hypothetical protein